MKEITKKVKTWNELVDFVETVNPFTETIVLSGWISDYYNGQTYVKELLFTTKDIKVLKKNVRKTKKVDKLSNKNDTSK